MLGLHSHRASMRRDENENVKGTFVLSVTSSTCSCLISKLLSCYTLIISRISACSCTISWPISWDCEPITIHFHNIADFGHRWFCEKLDERNLPYHLLWHFVKIPIVWREQRNTRWEKWLARWFTKCHLYTSHFSRFANIFSHSRQFADKCIVGFGKMSVKQFRVKRNEDVSTLSRSSCTRVWMCLFVRRYFVSFTSHWKSQRVPSTRVQTGHYRWYFPPKIRGGGKACEMHLL